jgi:hypothetical protein
MKPEEQPSGSDSLDAMVRPLLLYINKTSELQSLLYDMDLLPEQCEHGSRDWRNMLLLTEAWKNRERV